MSTHASHCHILRTPDTSDVRIKITQAPRNLQTAQSSGTNLLPQINPNNDQKAQLISFANNLLFCALTGYDVRSRSRTNKEQSNNIETPTIARALHAVNRMPNSKHRCVMISVYQQIKLLWLNSYKLSKK